MLYKLNVSCSETISKVWTQSAIDCYSIGCNCSICNLNRIYFSKRTYKCMMKYTVIELVRKIGKPEKNILEGSINEK